MDGVSAVVNRVADIRERIGMTSGGASFASHLAQQLEPSPAVPAPPQSTLAQLERKTVSGATGAELRSYLDHHGVEARNGRLEGSGLLVEVGGAWHGTRYLLEPAAKAWTEMRQAAALDGIDLRAIDMYRSWESQARAYEDHLAGRKKANVLPPGTSEHGNGLAVDITNGSLVGPGDPEWNWLQANASRFGWFPISNESWHWEYRG